MSAAVDAYLWTERHESLQKTAASFVSMHHFTLSNARATNGSNMAPGLGTDKAKASASPEQNFNHKRHKCHNIQNSTPSGR